MTNPTPKKETKVKAWAVVMFDGFIPDFTIENKMSDVMQIHSSKKAAQRMAADINSSTDDGKLLWKAVPCTIIYEI